MSCVRQQSGNDDNGIGDRREDAVDHALHPRPGPDDRFFTTVLRRVVCVDVDEDEVRQAVRYRLFRSLRYLHRALTGYALVVLTQRVR